MDTNRQKRILITLSLSILVIIAGCGEIGSDGENPERANEIEAELIAVSGQLAATEDRASTIKQKISTAHKKGVNTTNASRQFSTSTDSIAAAQSKLNQSEQQLNESNYSEAANRLREAKNHLSEANTTLGSAVESLEMSYTVALNSSRSNLQAAYAEYQIAVEYVNDASSKGRHSAPPQARRVPLRRLPGCA